MFADDVTGSGGSESPARDKDIKEHGMVYRRRETNRTMASVRRFNGFISYRQAAHLGVVKD